MGKLNRPLYINEATAMGLLSLWGNPMPLLQTQQSIFVLSDTEFRKYKQKQTESEIAELERLVDSHKSSIERLEKTIADLRNTLPAE